MKYFVIRTVWVSERKEQLKEIAGTFDTYINAKLFKEAYSKHYSADPKIVSEEDLLNAINAE